MGTCRHQLSQTLKLGGSLGTEAESGDGGNDSAGLLPIVPWTPTSQWAACAVGVGQLPWAGRRGQSSLVPPLSVGLGKQAASFEVQGEERPAPCHVHLGMSDWS